MVEKLLLSYSGFIFLLFSQWLDGLSFISTYSSESADQAIVDMELSSVAIYITACSGQ